MRKINSIGYGAVILMWGCIFALFIPSLLYLLAELFNLMKIFALPIRISIGVGFSILLFLIILLSIELNQDRKISKYHQNNMNTKIVLPNGLYECQNCGNTRVNENEKSCKICGIVFKERHYGI